MSGVLRWFEEQSEGAPEALRARSAHYLEPLRDAADPAEAMAGAATAALAAALARPGDRAVALDLLTADALVTLALKAQAAGDPARLGAFAATLRRSGAEIR